MRLRELDEQLLPRLATWLRAELESGGQRRARLAELLRAGWQSVLHPAEPGRLRRLDERYASTGPLSLLRDVPQLGVLVVAAVFLTGAGVALTMGGGQDQEQDRQDQQVASALPFALGPPAGSNIEDHFATAREAALDVSREDPEDRFLALVSLTDEITAAEAQQLVTQNDLTARRIYVRAPVSGPLPEVLTVETPGDLVAALREVFAQTAGRKAQEQQEFVALARSITSTSEEEASFKAFYEQAARTAGEEAAAYRSACACVFALVVEADARVLTGLTALPAVRGVELAARGAQLPALDIQPLSPDATGVVEPPQTVTGGS